MPSSDYLPTPAEVAKLVKSRTRDRYTNLLGTFTTETDPDLATVTDLISQAGDEVAVALGPDIPDYRPDDDEADHEFLRKTARSLVTILSAMNVELTVAPEQTQDDRSAYARLEKRYESLKKAAIEAIEEARGDDAGGGESAATSSSGVPIGYFPAVTNLVDVQDPDDDPRF